MAVQLGRGMSSEHHPVQLGELSFAQGLGEAAGAGSRRIDAALNHKIAHREAGQLASP
jgi:hypothetical protein